MISNFARAALVCAGIYSVTIAAAEIAAMSPAIACANSALQDVSTTRKNLKTGAGPNGPADAIINTTRSNIKHSDPSQIITTTGGPADAPISTSRSNISRPSLSATGAASSGPADAAINTSRSNITRPSLSATGGASGGPADAAVNTSRSNISRPGLKLTGKSKKSSQGMTVDANPNLSTH
jgi:hypothetical protein